MKLYHFSDQYFEEGDHIEPGHFSITVANAQKIKQEFEDVLEARRLLNPSASISRKSCLFTVSSEYADGFKTQRRYMYELELLTTASIQKCNHAIITYFTRFFPLNDSAYFTDKLHLLDAYWLNVQSCDDDGSAIEYEEEILVDSALPILRRIDLLA